MFWLRYCVEPIWPLYYGTRSAHRHFNLDMHAAVAVVRCLTGEEGKRYGPFVDDPLFET